MLRRARDSTAVARLTLLYGATDCVQWHKDSRPFAASFNRRRNAARLVFVAATGALSVSTFRYLRKEFQPPTTALLVLSGVGLGAAEGLWWYSKAALRDAVWVHNSRLK